MGSTDRGYDIYYGIVWGSRTSLDVAVKVVFTGTFIAAVIGAVSGYYGGRIDDIVMRITDVFIAIPGLVLALAIIAFLYPLMSYLFPLQDDEYIE